MAIKKQILLTVILAWLLIPTGTPDDIITLWLIKQLGQQVYIFLLVIVGLLMVHYHITPKSASKTMGSFINQEKRRLKHGFKKR
jgi:hypothetical protein